MKHLSKLLLAALALSACTSGPQLTKSGLDPQNFVSERDGKATALYTLTNESGMEVCITNFGGRIVSIMVPAADGSFKDVVLGFDNVTAYFPENNATDFGAAIGRYANRIGGGTFTLDGVVYDLPKNNFGHCLHGGPTGWQYKVFEAVEADGSHLKLKVESPDGDNNFPGNITAFVTYTLTPENVIEIAYEATTDAPTVINMTNHSYFNLAGAPATHRVTDDVMTVYASNFTPVDNTFKTTGEIIPVEGTPMDFTQPKRIGDEIDAEYDQNRFGLGYDHNWVLDAAGDAAQKAAEVYCPETGILLTVCTSEPGIQIYTGNFLDGKVTGKGGVVYERRAAICLESQKYPDTPNKPEWPSAVLRPGETYTSFCSFGFSVKAE